MKTVTSVTLTFVLIAGVAGAQTPVGTSGATRPTPSATAAPAPAPAAAVITAADYRLTAGDKLRIEVYKDTQLSQSLQIRPDGKITLPLVGDIAAAGRTSVELRDAIAKALDEYIAKPVVTVIVTETTPQVVYVTGEVNKPGALTLVNGQMTILQAIAMAGGFTDFAKKGDVRILRKGPSGVQTLRFNYKDALDDENRREPLQLLPGDTVIVR